VTDCVLMRPSRDGGNFFRAIAETIDVTDFTAQSLATNDTARVAYRFTP
jgi:hypothetical protein